MVKRILVILYLFFAGTSSLYSQEVSPDGFFIEDSVTIGEAIQYALYIKYPKDLEVIFPDSSGVFFPFEYYDRTYFTTRLDSAFAYDSVVYQLTSFEIEPIQYLQVPIYLIDGKDSTEVFPPLDSIYLQEMILELPDSLILKANTGFLQVSEAFNYPYLMIGLASLGVLVIILYLVFGKTVVRKIRIYRLRKEYERFSNKFENGINALKTKRDSSFVEQSLVVWKAYMEKLEDKPFTKYTTKEILRSGYDPSLKETLMNIDKSIYGHVSDQEIHKNFESLENFTLERYKLKLQEVNNG